jgi:hypothetical protein
VVGSGFAELAGNRDADHHQDQQHEQLLHDAPRVGDLGSPAGYPAGEPPRPDRTTIYAPPHVSTGVAEHQILYEEAIGPAPRAWIWLPIIVVITGLAIAPVVVPIAIAAWIVNVLRYRGAVIRVDPDYVWVNRRWARLAALDPATLGRASNTWPWRSFNPRYLGGNPIWTRDSVGIRGVDGGRKYWLSVGTNRRDELVEVLQTAMPVARQRAQAGATQTLPPPGWHPDPWRESELRWWDGQRWTGYRWPPAP